MTSSVWHRTVIQRRLGVDVERAPTLPPPRSTRVLGLESPTISTADTNGSSGSPATAGAETAGVETAARSTAPGSIVITHETVIVGERAQALLKLYIESLQHLDFVSATEHTESDDKILWYFEHPGLTKVIAWDGDEPIGLAIITNDLSLVTDPSPRFFANTYPDHAARNAVFYGLTVLVKESERGLSAFSRLYLEMWQIPASVNGVLAFDICQWNVETLNVARIIDGIAANFPRCTWREIDRQIWYVAELPEPLR